LTALVYSGQLCSAIVMTVRYNALRPKCQAAVRSELAYWPWASAIHHSTSLSQAGTCSV